MIPCEREISFASQQMPQFRGRAIILQRPPVGDFAAGLRHLHTPKAADQSVGIQSSARLSQGQAVFTHSSTAVTAAAAGFGLEARFALRRHKATRENDSMEVLGARSKVGAAWWRPRSQPFPKLGLLGACCRVISSRTELPSAQKFLGALGLLQ